MYIYMHVCMYVCVCRVETMIRVLRMSLMKRTAAQRRRMTIHIRMYVCMYVCMCVGWRRRFGY